MKKKYGKITFRLPKDDLIGLKAKASQSGIDYQPLLAALIHKYIEPISKLISFEIGRTFRKVKILRSTSLTLRPHKRYLAKS